EDEARLVEIDGNAGERGKSGKPLAQPAPLLQHDRLWRVKHRPGRLSAGKTDAGRHHRYPDRAVELVVEGRADYDVGVRIGRGPDTARRLVNLVKGEVVASGDGDEQPARTLHAHIVEKRIGDGSLCRLDGAALAARFACAHHRLAHAGHDGAD